MRGAPEELFEGHRRTLFDLGKRPPRHRATVRERIQNELGGLKAKALDERPKAHHIAAIAALTAARAGLLRVREPHLLERHEQMHRLAVAEGQRVDDGA